MAKTQIFILYGYGYGGQIDVESLHESDTLGARRAYFCIRRQGRPGGTSFRAHKIVGRRRVGVVVVLCTGVCTFTLLHNFP